VTAFLCVRLNCWPIDRLRRRHPELRGKPVVLVRPVAARDVIVSASDEAAAVGATVGMTLAEARASCADLLSRPPAPEDDRRALEALGRWLVRFSPSVAVSPPDAVILEVAGSELLFGSLERLRSLVAGAVARLGLPARTALAPTPAAARALATYSRDGDSIHAECAPIARSGGGTIPPFARLSNPCEVPGLAHAQRTCRSRHLKSRDREGVGQSSGPVLANDAARSTVGPSGRPLGRVVPTAPLPHGRGSLNASTDMSFVRARGQAVDPSNSSPLARVANPCHGEGRSLFEHAPASAVDNLAALLAPLPIAALGIDPAECATFRSLGLTTVGHVAATPRKAIVARFGAAPLDALDRLLGRRPEPLDYLRHVSPVKAAVDFDGVVESLEATWAAFARLIPEVVADLARRGAGARRVRVAFRRAYASPAELSVCLSRPSRDPAVLINLLRCAADALELDEGFTGVELSVPAYQRVAEDQETLPGGGAGVPRQGGGLGKAGELDYLLDRLRARLSPPAVERARPVASHVPEEAVAYDSTSRADDPGQPPGSSSASLFAKKVTGQPGRAAEPPPAVVRPLRLLATPQEVGVVVTPSDDRMGRPAAFSRRGVSHTLARVRGPERITGSWWRGRDKTRDYFAVEDDGGQGFWIFRVAQTFKWYVHGVFG
jgi:protein ImuB